MVMIQNHLTLVKMFEMSMFYLLQDGDKCSVHIPILYICLFVPVATMYMMISVYHR